MRPFGRSWGPSFLGPCYLLWDRQETGTRTQDLAPCDFERLLGSGSHGFVPMVSTWGSDQQDESSAPVPLQDAPDHLCHSEGTSYLQPNSDLKQLLTARVRVGVKAS